MPVERQRRAIDRSGPVRLEELGLSDKQLAVIAVSDARRAVSGVEELGREPEAGLHRMAQGNPDLAAAFVARYSSKRDSDVA